jgi:hypothetical protein
MGEGKGESDSKPFPLTLILSPQGRGSIFGVYFLCNLQAIYGVICAFCLLLFTNTPPPNENRKIRPKGSQIPMKLVNISKLLRMINPTKKKSIPATKRRNIAAVTIGRVYPNLRW